ncbi:MAG: DMT family transporter, partial [Gaiellales bacterium]
MDHEHAQRETKAILPVLAVVAMTAIWGSTFVVIKDAVEELAIGSFLALRFLIAFLVLIAVRPGAFRRLSRVGMRRSAMLGLFYGVAQVLQTWGLHYTSPSISGFVTAMYIVFTPLILAVLFRTRVGAHAWIAVLIALIGIAVLSLQGLSVGPGELLTLASAFVYAAHIVALGIWARDHDADALSTIQLGVIVLVAIAAMPFDGGVQLPSTASQWWAVLYTGVVAGTIVLLLQTWAQARIAPTRAAVIMMLEPVFAAGFAVAVGVDQVTLRMLIGGSLVLVAMYIVELGPRR